MKIKLLFLVLLCVSISWAQAPMWYVAAAADTLVRPNDNTAYAIGDAINDTTTSAKKVLVFNFTVRSSATAPAFGYVTDVVCLSDSGNAQSIFLHLFTDSTLAPRVADNSAITWTWTGNTAPRYLGKVALTDTSTLNTGAGKAQANNLGMGVVFAASSTKLYGILEAASVFTPKRFGKYRVMVKVSVR